MDSYLIGKSHTKYISSCCCHWVSVYLVCFSGLYFLLLPASLYNGASLEEAPLHWPTINSLPPKFRTKKVNPEIFPANRRVIPQWSDPLPTYYSQGGMAVLTTRPKYDHTQTPLFLDSLPQYSLGQHWNKVFIWQWRRSTGSTFSKLPQAPVSVSYIPGWTILLHCMLVCYCYTIVHCCIFCILVHWTVHHIFYCTLLYYTILYSTILYYTVLYYTILYYTILYCTLLYSILPYTAWQGFFHWPLTGPPVCRVTVHIRGLYFS